MTPRRSEPGVIIVWGLLAHSPFGGMTWQVLNHLVGLRSLGYEVWYIEDSDEPTFNLGIETLTEEYDDNIRYTRRYLSAIGMEDHWAFRLPSTQTVVGNLNWEGLIALYQRADVVLNLCGSHELMAHHDHIRRLVYVETDPGANQFAVATRSEPITSELARYDLIATYATNLGDPSCLLPTFATRWTSTRPPVAIDLWKTIGSPRNPAFTTVMNWATPEGSVSWQGRRWEWSKRPSFERVIPLPLHSVAPLEVAVRLAPEETMNRLSSHRWRTTDARLLDPPGAYRRYIRSSTAEFSVAKEQYVALRSGWISDRTVCYLAAGRPAVVEGTGVKGVPLGDGLLEFTTLDEAEVAIADVAAHEDHHAAAATELAHEYFDASRVLQALLDEIDF